MWFLATSLTIGFMVSTGVSARDVGALGSDSEEATGPQLFPPRSSGGLAGSEFLRITAGLGAEQREEAIFREVLSGNVPDHIRRLVPVNTTYLTPAGRVLMATVFVLPDYLAIGTNDDYVRIPVNFNTARRLATELGMVLPTRKIVDAVYQQADLRLAPKPLGASSKMCTNEAYFVHNEKINRQLGAMADDAVLFAGHKKDIIISRLQMAAPNQMVIYGWHKGDDQPIQQMSVAHTANYVDYSHGVRFVSETVVVDGKPYSIYEVLEAPELAPALSYEGPIAGTQRIMGARYKTASDAPTI